MPLPSLVNLISLPYCPDHGFLVIFAASHFHFVIRAFSSHLYFDIRAVASPLHFIIRAVSSHKHFVIRAVSSHLHFDISPVLSHFYFVITAHFQGSLIQPSHTRHIGEGRLENACSSFTEPKSGPSKTHGRTETRKHGRTDARTQERTDAARNVFAHYSVRSSLKLQNM